MKRLAEIDNIVGVKEASGNLAQVASILAQVPDRFNVLSGDDAVALPVIALGGRGLISTTSNEIPAEMADLVDSSRRGDLIAARQILRRYLPLIEVNFIESNPIPVKAAMALMGLMEPVWRLPLVPPKPESQAKIEKVLTALGLMPVHARS
jgi:4-hydroxy-tetrahydrodipicolinate synthase